MDTLWRVVTTSLHRLKTCTPRTDGLAELLCEAAVPLQSGPKCPGGQQSLSSSMHSHSNRSGASCCLQHARTHRSLLHSILRNESLSFIYLWNHHVSTWSSICSSSWLHSKSVCSQADSTISSRRVSLKPQARNSFLFLLLGGLTYSTSYL